MLRAPSSRRFWVVVAVLSVLGTFATRLARPSLVSAPARVHVRFTKPLNAEARSALERRFSLEPFEQLAPDAWRYELTDTSTENVAALVKHEDVADTQYIDRETFTVVANTDPGARRPGRLGRYWPALAYGLVDFGPAMFTLTAVLATIGAAWPRSAAVVYRFCDAMFTQLMDRQRRYQPSGFASLLSALLFGSAVSGFVTLMGVHDLENYEHSFFSLDRGTRLATVKVMGQPIYSLAIGLGARLPLHGNLGASPAAMLAPHLPEPMTYWLLLTLAIGSAVFIVRHALEPLCGRFVFWAGAGLLFCSLPMVNYTIFDDWPETAVTYCSVVACVFAPHALLAVAQASSSGRRRLIGGAGLLGLVWSALAISHPGYWPHLAAALTASAVLAGIRSDDPLPTRLGVVAALGCTSIAVVGLLAPDVLRELSVAGDFLRSMHRETQGPEAGLWESNLAWPLKQSVRAPFTFLLLTLGSLSVALRWPDPRRRRLMLGAGLASIAFGFGAAHLSAGTSAFAPSVVWGLRDPAIGFAILCAAAAAGVLKSNQTRYPRRVRSIGALLLACGLVGPVVAAEATFRVADLAEVFDSQVSPRGLAPPSARIFLRGLDSNDVATGSRIALWPGVGSRMRNRKESQAEFIDAGYVLVTATVKQRTMKPLVDDNSILFDQSTSLPADALCKTSVVQFLQLNYLVAPTVITCEPWRAVAPPLDVDRWLTVHAANASDMRVRALPSQAISEAMRRLPAFGSGSSLLSALSPLPDTSVTIGPRDVVIRQARSSSAAGLTMVLPVAFDSAWTVSSGRLEKVGGLLALTGADQTRVVLSYSPDVVSMLRAMATDLSQWLTCLGLIGLAFVAPTTMIVARP